MNPMSTAVHVPDRVPVRNRTGVRSQVRSPAPRLLNLRLLGILLPGLVLLACGGCSQMPSRHGEHRLPLIGGAAKGTGGLKQAGGAKEPNASPELPPEETARVCLATAEELERNGHLREAILLYEKARQHDAKAIDYARRLAVLYDRAGQAERALAEYERALASRPDDNDLLNDLGYFHYRQGRYGEAERAFREVLRRAPDHSRATVNLGLALAEQGDTAGSFQVFASLLGEAAAHYNVGALLARQGRIPEARQALGRALALDPGLDRSRALLAYLDSREPPRGDRRRAGSGWAGSVGDDSGRDERTVGGVTSGPLAAAGARGPHRAGPVVQASFQP